MKRHKGFQRHGRGVYRCTICARATRVVTQCNDRICPECYELAGLENSILDGAATVAEIAPERDWLVAKAVKQGSDEAKIRKSFEELWGAE